ncbi:condensation domain-containing protein, partial [Streptomyces violaceorubidus]
MELTTRGAGVKQTGLDAVLPLTPLQEGLLFHGLFDPKADDIYVSQHVLDVRGPLDAHALRAAADALLARHASLRVGFRHEGLSKPVQIVPSSVPTPWHEADLAGEPDPAARAARAEELLRADRARRFDLAAPPLVRFTLLRTGEQEYRFSLTFHHLLVDGWSLSVLLHELFTLYGNGADLRALPPVTPYRTFLGWLAKQDRKAAVAAWADALAGLRDPSLVAPDAEDARAAVPEHVFTTLTATQTERLTARSRELGVTVNTVVQGAWAILLSRLLGSDDVVFGATVSGRPPEIPGVENMVGLFINTVPVRVPVRAAEPVEVLLRRLQSSQLDLLPHQHLGLTDIQQAGGLPELFDTMVVFENYPHDVGASASRTPADAVRVTGQSTSDGSHYPLTLVAVPGPTMRFRLDHRPDVFDTEAAEVLLARFVRVLEAVVGEPSVRVGVVPVLSVAERAAVVSGWSADAGESVPAPGGGVLGSWFSRVAGVSPEAVAVVCGQVRWSFGEVEE